MDNKTALRHSVTVCRIRFIEARLEGSTIQYLVLHMLIHMWLAHH